MAPLCKIIRAHATYANVTATLALFVALGGGSFAVAALSGSEKKVVKKIAKKQANKRITARAPNLSVRSAQSADTANTADQATNASHARTADTATNANHATSADQLRCAPPVAGTGQMVKAGAVCIDRYEASVWTQPKGGTRLTASAQIDAACPDNGQPTGGANCQNFYARSVAGVEPARFITWFQAQQALANSGKRLPTNAEWQQAVSGTPDSTACNVNTGSVANTDANAGCVSRFGAFDMVGNVAEWVADWDEEAADCENWPAGFGSDFTCIGRGSGEASTRFPAALIRGGSFINGTGAGPFQVNGLAQPQASADLVGFRGAR